MVITSKGKYMCNRKINDTLLYKYPLLSEIYLFMIEMDDGCRDDLLHPVTQK